MKKLFLIIPVIACIMLCACMQNNDTGTNKKGESIIYKQISQSEAKAIMDSDLPHIILDTRETEEYEAEHIPGAMLIPHTQIEEMAEDMIPDKEQVILVYCRSGRRSKIAAEALAGLGYKNVLEFGGITDWQYETVK